MRTIVRTARLSVFSFIIAFAPLTVSAAVVPINMLDGSFSPANVSVNLGDTIVWTNYGSLQHVVVSNNGAFSSSAIAPGSNFSYTFNTPGTIGFYDPNYSSMAGTVTVAGSGNVPAGTSSTNPNVAALEAQAEALIQQINQYQGQVASGSTGTTVVTTSANCPNIGRSLKLGSSGSDVARLQQFLAQDPSVYPAGLVTGYYGALTQAAVQSWQIKYNIVSSGTPATTGFGVVGPRTAAAIALLCSAGGVSTTTTGGGTTSTQLPQVGGAIQVTPTSGAAPLAVTVNVSVNITNSCAPATYVLNFGDGTQSTAIPVPAGACVPASQLLTHTYQYGGTYTIVLAAGGHQSTAIVTVSGNPSPQQAAASGIPADSMQASITSGISPLNVVFTGTVSSLSSFGCSGTCTDTINFGDGAVGLVQLPTQTGSWQSYIINHSYTAAGTYTAQLESASGAADGSPITITVTNPVSVTTPTTTTSGGSTDNGTYGIVTVTPNVGGNPLAITTAFAIPSCASYQIKWGDNSSVSTQTAVCQSGGSTVTLSHTYTTSGTYTISVNNGSGVLQASAQVAISQ